MLVCNLLLESVVRDIKLRINVSPLTDSSEDLMVEMETYYVFPHHFHQILLQYILLVKKLHELHNVDVCMCGCSNLQSLFDIRNNNLIKIVKHGPMK